MAFSFVLVSSYMQAQQDTLSLSEVFLTDETSIYSNQNQSIMTRGSSWDRIHLTCRQNQPFFCKMESKWENKGGRAMKFRLGNLDVVDHYEGKGNSYRID